jgi:hypothetical protein
VCPMPGNTGYSVVIGTGGTGVAAGTGNSGSGSTITIQGVTYTAGGGAGGPGVTATTTGITAAGGLGGTASNGQLNVQGQPGQPGFVTASSTGLGTAGSGGSGPWGGGGRTRCDSTGAGNAAGAYGGGGGGAYSSAASGADNAGGAGFAGVLIVEEYSDLLLPMPQADPEVVKSPTRKQPSPDDWLSVPQVQRPSWLQDDVARRPFPADYKRVPYQDDSIGVPQIQRPGWFFDEPQRSAIAKATHKPAVDEWQLKPLPFPGLPPSEEPSPRRSKPFSQQDDFYLAPHTTVSTTKAIPWSDPETVRAPSRRQPVDDQPIGSPALTKPSWLQDDSIQLGKRPKVQADDWLSVPALTKPSWLQDDVQFRKFSDPVGSKTIPVLMVCVARSRRTTRSAFRQYNGPHGWSTTPFRSGDPNRSAQTIGSASRRSRSHLGSKTTATQSPSRSHTSASIAPMTPSVIRHSPGPRSSLTILSPSGIRDRSRKTTGCLSPRSPSLHGSRTTWLRARSSRASNECRSTSGASSRSFQVSPRVISLGPTLRLSAPLDARSRSKTSRSGHLHSRDPHGSPTTLSRTASAASSLPTIR